MFVRSGFPFNYDVRKAGVESSLRCKDKSRAQQSAKAECDINTIVKRFGLTGKLPENVRAPVYADFEGIFDFQSALNQVIAAEQAFMAMPASVRSRFGNDPQLFVEFCSDEKNIEEMRKLGLAVPAPVVEPVEPIPVVLTSAAPVAAPGAPGSGAPSGG